MSEEPQIKSKSGTSESQIPGGRCLPIAESET